MKREHLSAAGLTHARQASMLAQRGDPVNHEMPRSMSGAESWVSAGHQPLWRARSWSILGFSAQTIRSHDALPSTRGIPEPRHQRTAADPQGVNRKGFPIHEGTF